MVSPVSVSQYGSQNSKVFPKPGFEDLEIWEIPPPISRYSKSKSSKQKEKVIFPEIIDLEELPDLCLDGSSKGKAKEGGCNPKRKRSSNWSENEPSPKRTPTSRGTGESSRGKSSSRNQTGTTSVSSEPKIVDEKQRQFDLFKTFDMVEDYSNHHFAGQYFSDKTAPKNWAKKIQEEWKILEKDLPDTIFVRVYESRMDLLRAVIIGAEGTPYHDGLFFFDVFFPSSYPSCPPKVHYHSGGLRINPNLYNCGKVCLSLLNTWDGHGREKWQPNKSTMLQVLVSIQGLILNAKPYYNEPGYARSYGSKAAEKLSFEYSENTFIYNLQTMVYSMRRPPKHFEAYVVGHFRKVARDVLLSCKAYLEGVQVGCLVKGGVQDVDEGNISCSSEFRNNLAGYITTLVNQFTQIGAKDCQEFLSLSQHAKPASSTKTILPTSSSYTGFFSGMFNHW